MSLHLWVDQPGFHWRRVSVRAFGPANCDLIIIIIIIIKYILGAPSRMSARSLQKSQRIKREGGWVVVVVGGHTKKLTEYVGRYAFYNYAISVSHSIQTL